MVFRLTAVLFKLTRETFYSGDIPDFGAKDPIPTGLLGDRESEAVFYRLLLYALLVFVFNWKKVAQL